MDFLDYSDSSAETIEDRSDVSTLLHSDNFELILSVDLD